MISCLTWLTTSPVHSLLQIGSHQKGEFHGVLFYMVDHCMLTVANSELKVNSIIYYLTWLTTPPEYLRMQSGAQKGESNDILV